MRIGSVLADDAPFIFDHSPVIRANVIMAAGDLSVPPDDGAVRMHLRNHPFDVLFIDGFLHFDENASKGYTIFVSLILLCHDGKPQQHDESKGAPEPPLSRH